MKTILRTCLNSGLRRVVFRWEFRLQAVPARCRLKAELQTGVFKPALSRLALAMGMALFLQFAGAPGVRAAETATNDAPLPFPLIDRFENFQMKDGLPAHKAHCVLRASDGKLWVGTYNGVLVREDGKFRHIGIKDELDPPDGHVPGRDHAPETSGSAPCAG